MFHLFFSIFWMFASPTSVHSTANDNTQVVTESQTAGDDATGETGHVPNKPPKP